MPPPPWLQQLLPHRHPCLSLVPFLDFQPWVRAWFPFGLWGWLRSTSVSTVGSVYCIICLSRCIEARVAFAVAFAGLGVWGARGPGVLTCLRTQEAGLDPTPMVFWGLSEAPPGTQGA